MEIYFARHGESEDDLSDSYGGASDFPLTERGRGQAAKTGEMLKGRGIQQIYSSPLRRASETAAIIREKLDGIPLEIDFDLRERNTYGVMSGLTRAEAARVFGYLIERFPGQPGKDKTCAPGGEEYEDFVYRVGRTWARLIANCKEREVNTVLVVTHGKFTLGLFTEVLGLGDSYNKELGAVKLVRYEPPVILEEIASD
jgi:broad specificity phosphatase PhoE